MTDPSPDFVVTHARRRVGQVLGGRYRLTSLLGVGGMGAVYAAVHVRNGHAVALKVLHERLASDPEHRRLFRREGLLANRIKHPGVVPVIDDDDDDGTVFLVLPLLTGETLRHRWERSLRRLPADESAYCALKVLDVLQAAHVAKIVHRDVKPENVYVTSAGEVRVLDFGIARLLEVGERSSTTRTGLVLGTPEFMAPEQARGRSQEIDARTDLWGVGAMLFTLLSGRAVHEGASPTELLIETATKRARRLRDVALDVPAAIADVVDRALQFERTARWPDAQTMASALREACTAVFGQWDEAAALPGTFIRGELSPAVATERLGNAEERDEKAGPGDNALAETRTADALRIRTELRKATPGDRSVRIATLNWIARGGGGAIVLGLLAVALAAGVLLSLRRTSREKRASVAFASSSPTERSPCTSNHACSLDLGQPAICRHEDGDCVALNSEDCHELADQTALESDDTVWFGDLNDLSDPNFATAQVDEDAADLGRQDFAGALVALRASGQHLSPIALVSCDTAKDAQRAARHLADDLRIAAVIDGQKSAPLLDLVGSVLGPHRILTIASSAQSPLVTQVPHPEDTPPLVWRTESASAQHNLALARFIEAELEPRLRASGIQRIRVAVVRWRAPNSWSTAESVFDTIRFNGASALDNGDNYREFIVEDRGTRDAAYGSEVEKLRQFAPNIVVGMGTVVFTRLIPVFDRQAHVKGAGPFYRSPHAFVGA